MSLVQNDLPLPPTEFFTGRRALPHATLLDIFSQPSSFALLYPLQTSKKHISQSTAQHGCPRAIRELQRVGAERGKCAYRTCANQLRRVGVFATLTNAYAIVAVGASENFYRYAHMGARARTARHGASVAEGKN